ncbi:hypothetical protein SAMN05216223_13152 [Actinacidiphila yanglinensis]|uniref:Uncharacterized protein n=1 Tax=Actinacidiphila yanglinensis TaxID=310779 RepID=A0A1H6EC75_9ACTN|nr:hypothetical protein [Actinacidiphila yanglinensis]SEG94873.1 hypothetical protein SAMN05216223_13152 [Actinacidiphila yanglinensis]
MDRILSGTPQHSKGALTIVALATEVGVFRNALTQRHLDLKNESYPKVKERGQPGNVEIRLRQQVVKLKTLRQNDQTELASRGRTLRPWCHREPAHCREPALPNAVDRSGPRRSAAPHLASAAQAVSGLEGLGRLS